MSAVDKKRYPLATISGQPIPLDIIRPSGVLRKDFSTLLGTAPESLPIGTELVFINASSDCFIRFENSVAIRPASGNPSVIVPNTQEIRAGAIFAISPVNLFFSVIGDISGGTLTLQFLETWSGVALDVAQTRK